MASDVLEKIDRARVVVAELNYGKREWKGLHEPASEDATDVVVMEALRCAALEISRLTRELEAAREIIRDLVDREPICVALRSKYVDVRIDGGTWDDARRFVGLDLIGDDDVTPQRRLE